MITGAFLSITFLGERFQWKYDLLASIHILTGSACIVSLSDKSDKVHDLVRAKRLLESINGLYYVVYLVVLLASTLFSIHWYVVIYVVTLLTRLQNKV